jgi:hypothetical protein
VKNRPPDQRPEAGAFPGQRAAGSAAVRRDPVDGREKRVVGAVDERLIDPGFA